MNDTYERPGADMQARSEAGESFEEWWDNGHSYLSESEAADVFAEVSSLRAQLAEERVKREAMGTGAQWNAALDIVRNGRAASEESYHAGLNDPMVQTIIAALRQWKFEIERAERRCRGNECESFDCEVCENARPAPDETALRESDIKDDSYLWGAGRHQRVAGIWFRIVDNKIVDRDQYRHDLESRANALLRSEPREE